VLDGGRTVRTKACWSGGKQVRTIVGQPAAA
jgi:hypothetical protein